MYVAYSRVYEKRGSKLEKGEMFAFLSSRGDFKGRALVCKPNQSSLVVLVNNNNTYMKSVRDWYGPDSEKVIGSAEITDTRVCSRESFTTVFKGHKSVLVWLHTVGMLDVMEKDRFGDDIALVAAEKGNKSILEWLHALGLLDSKDTDKYGSNVAHVAARYGQEAILEWLYSVGMLDAMEKDGDHGWTIAHHAARCGYESILMLLHSGGLLDVMEKDNDGWNVARVAESFGQKSILAWLRSVGLLDAKDM